ncbi:MAG: hypothetical protein GY953_38315, partial [bacterium]|nr:hypothetical protein [bacterium]
MDDLIESPASREGARTAVHTCCVGVLAVLTLTGCGAHEEPAPRPEPAHGAATGDFDSKPCVHVAREVEYAAECGTLIVP